eukprot:m.130796 g.130796  ORF g.130796 m.130796 type:complete len:386 (+) comp29501_c1_seq1:185-1342(+)
MDRSTVATDQDEAVKRLTEMSSVTTLKNELLCRGAASSSSDDPKDLARQLLKARQTHKSINLTTVRKDIKTILDNAPNHDDGSYAPLCIRFAWHLSGTYDKEKKNGGSNGATMRFKTESEDPENAGLPLAIKILEPIKQKYPWLSQADIWILAGYVAIETTGGPHIRFATGRQDFTMEEAVASNGPTGCPFGDGKHNPCGSRLPSADLGENKTAGKNAPMHEKEASTIAAMRGTFQRMGFNDKETACLIVLGHQYGRCHPHVSGYDGPWYLFDPARWNVYEHGLGYISIYSHALQNFREIITAAGKRQYIMNMMGGEWMMLLTDMALWWDPEYKKHVRFYDQHRAEFKADACVLWKRLTELGCDRVGLVEEATPIPTQQNRHNYY